MMNDLQLIIVETPGLSLLHSLWWLTIPAALLLIFLFVVPSSWTRLRYITFCSTLALMVALPVTLIPSVGVSLEPMSAASASDSTLADAELEHPPAADTTGTVDNIDQSTATESQPSVKTKAPADVPWPTEKVPSFAAYPPSGTGLRVQLDDRRWVELNSLATTGQKVGDRDLKVFWKPNGELLNPPADFDPKSLVPPPTEGESPRAAREAAIQIVAPQGTSILLKSSGGGGYSKQPQPVDEEFVQVPIQQIVTGLPYNHFSLTARVSQEDWEKVPMTGNDQLRILQSDEERRLILVGHQLDDFAWKLQIQYDGEKPKLTEPFVNGLRLKSGFLKAFQDKLSDEDTRHKATIFGFDKKRPMPKIINLQRSRYDTVTFDNLAVYPGPESAVRVSVNDVPISEAHRLTFSEPDDQPVIPATANEKTEWPDPVSLQGQVTDSTGAAVANCWVGMFVQPQIPNEAKAEASAFDRGHQFVAEAQTDAEGNFTIAAPKNHFVFEGSFWAVRSDGTSGTLRMNCTWAHLQKNLKISMKEDQATVRVVDPDGNPLSEAEVRLQAVRKPHSATHRLPLRVQQKLSQTTDQDGTVQLKGWPTEAIRGVAVQSEAYGIQYLSDRSASSWVKDGEPLALTLRPVASLRGTVVGYDARQQGPLLLEIRTEKYDRGRPPLHGRAILKVASDGSFQVPKILAGRITMASSLSPDSDWKIRFHDIPGLEPKEDRIVQENPEMVKATVVRQRIIKNDTGEGIPDMKLITLWGNAVEGNGSWNSSKATVTDAAGWWRAKVLPGKINARIRSVPKGYEGTAWFDGRNGYLGVEHHVPASDQIVTLPPERYVPSKTLSGQLLLPDGSPALDWSIYGHPISWKDVGVGGVNTDRDGKFTWTYPTGYRPRLIHASNRQWLTEHQFQDNRAYPIIKSEDPLILQIPATERSP